MSSGINTPRDADAYARQFAQLLPKGPAWNFAPDGPFARLLAALATEYARVDSRALDLIEEADPRTTLELLPDWERVAGLPDTCTGAPDEVSERQVALHQKIAGIGGQNRAAFIEVAARLGYQVEIIEHRPARIGDRVGDDLNGEDWAHAWTMKIRPFEGYLEESTFLAVAEVGDRIGVRLRGFGALDLECVIRRLAPAHTTVLFAYEVEPSADFWFDFTQ
ncbi:putative phage tail protein [uncultured Novosphingobium sp.]|uniref:YmfQ family protein n=1 Tax=uncultured Novosphingobium sp. TaxID=292277 RepID=UPI0025920889|nr:putative phage tail protein [uncultured Novosphingobium sp.]